MQSKIKKMFWFCFICLGLLAIILLFVVFRSETLSAVTSQTEQMGDEKIAGSIANHPGQNKQFSFKYEPTESYNEEVTIHVRREMGVTPCMMQTGVKFNSVNNPGIPRVIGKVYIDEKCDGSPEHINEIWSDGTILFKKLVDYEPRDQPEEIRNYVSILRMALNRLNKNSN